MLVFGALSFKVLADDTVFVTVSPSAIQSLNLADVQELLSWLNHFSQNYYSRSRNTRSNGGQGGYGGDVGAIAPVTMPTLVGQY